MTVEQAETQLRVVVPIEEEEKKINRNNISKYTVSAYGEVKRK
jgi:hypothetical protein